MFAGQKTSYYMVEALSRNLRGPDPDWWHQRYLQQAEWTRSLRHHLYRRLEIARCQRILEVGCGTGAIAEELAERTTAEVHGLDADRSALALLRGRPRGRGVCLAAGDAEALPYPDGSFDLIATHYFWLWAGDPPQAARECRRVLRSGGVLAALAEPDYSRRKDVPNGNPPIGEFLSQDLKERGANPEIGAGLRDIFIQAGFATEAGMLDGEVGLEAQPEIFQQEWEMLARLGYPSSELDSLKASSGSKIIMPVHWAIGRRL